jgi:hypothetical protein
VEPDHRPHFSCADPHKNRPLANAILKRAGLPKVLVVVKNRVDLAIFERAV